MNKISTIGTFTIAALLTAVASGCAAPLTTSETCVELRAITAGYPTPLPSTLSEREKVYEEFASKVEKLAGNASKTLQDDVKAMAERVRRNASGDIASGAEWDQQDAAKDRLERICKF